MRRTVSLSLPRLFLLALAVTALPALDAWAQSDCPEGNLLAGRKPVHWQDIAGDAAVVTDGKVAREGAMWNASGLTAVLDSAVATLTWDLGGVYPLQALYVQSDANDTLKVWGSVDGQQFRPIGAIDPKDGVHGLRGRPASLGGVPVRYLRIGEGEGDEFYSLSEVQAFCRLPNPFPPQLQVVAAPKQAGSERWWNDDSSRWWEFIWASLVFALLYWGGVVLKAEGRPNHLKKLRDWLLAVSLLISSLTYVNFGYFHFGNFIHSWDTFHYYVGSKYFKELGYSRLYECVAVADYEEPHLRRRVELRKITNLRTNALETTAEILAHPENCTKHFSKERWQAFKHDIAYFRSKEGAKRWDDTSTDHGYNATPVWNIAGSTLANLSPASDWQIRLLNFIDPAYYLGMIAIVWWAFGWRVTAVGMAVFATNFPSRFYWTGGAFLRWDWLFYTVAAICLLRKNRPLLAGVSIGYATLLRVFPGFMLAGPVIAWGVHLYQQRRLFPLTDISRRYLRFFVGGLIAIALLVPVSLVTTHGVETYKEFVANSIKHKETPLTNYMGLRTVVAFRPNEAGRFMKDGNQTDPWKRWKDARIDGYKQAKPLFIAIVLGWLVLIGWASRRHTEMWMPAAFGVTFIPIATELTCYYYAFIIGVAVLHEKKEEVGRILLLLTAASEFISLAPIKGMPTWLDEQYTLISLVTVVVFGMVLWWFGPGDGKAEALTAEAGKGAPEPAAASASASASAGAGGASTPAATGAPKSGGKKR